MVASSARDWGDEFLQSQPDRPDMRVQDTLNTATCTCDSDKRRGWGCQEPCPFGPSMLRRHLRTTGMETVLCAQLTKLKLQVFRIEHHLCYDGSSYSKPFGKQHFILSPDFSEWIQEPRFNRIADLVQFLLRRYSTFGLSFETDNYAAIAAWSSA
ncbi:hypothetical protein V8F06_014514 [Rhypophila decipiens]